MPNGRQYRTISAIIPKPPSKLHEDSLVAQQWANDKTTWRDVFKPKSAPNITPYEFLQMLVEGNDPYWDDTDSNNKKWVFPGRPDLEEKANNRSTNLDADAPSNNFKQASDIADDGVTIKNVTKSDVGNFNDAGVPNSTDVGSGLESNESNESNEKSDNEGNDVNAESKPSNKEETDENESDGSENSSDGDYYDDLPF